MLVSIVLSLANNHIMDYGEEGLNETLDTLIQCNIKTVGAGRNLSEARKPVIFEVNGVNIGILAYCDTYIAGRRRAGVAPTKYIEQDIQNLKKCADFIVVSIHQGMDISEYPLKSEVERMHQIIDWGANIILRHHPHVVQGLEEYNGGIILYSLGNFVFDYTIDPLWKDLEKAKHAVIFQCRLTKNKVLDYDIISVGLDKSFQPVVLQNAEKEKCDAYLCEISSKFLEIQSDEGDSQTEENYLKINAILAYHVILSSIKKGQFRNILLIVNKVSMSDFKALLKWTVNKVSLRVLTE